nr:hypothetical protein [Tanacetum cinerariifolium]
MEYYAVSSGAAPPKTKASVRKTKSSSDTSITPPTAAGTRLSTSIKSKQPAKVSKPKSLTVLSEVAMIEAEQIKLSTKRSLQQTHISQASGSGADEGTDDDQDDVDEGSDDQDNDDDQDDDNQDDDDQPIVEASQNPEWESARDVYSKRRIIAVTELQIVEWHTYKHLDWITMHDEGNDDENLGLIVGSEEGQDVEDNEGELYRDVNINLEGRVVQMADVHTTQEFEDTHVTLTSVNPDGQQQSSSVSSQFVTSMLNPTPNAGIDSLFETTSQMDVQAPTTVASLTLSAPTLTPSIIPTISTVPQVQTPPTTTLSNRLQDLSNFGSLFGFDHRLKTLEAKFSEFMQTNQFAGAVSSIIGIVQRYMDQQMNEAVKVAVQIQSDRLRDEAQAKNEKFLKNLDENIQKIIKEKVKEQVKVQVSKILPKIEKTVNEQLEAEVLTRSSNSSKTSYDVAADLSEMELKKILIEKMEGNKSIHRSDEQRNIYKALVEAYESDKLILDTYGDIVTLKKRHDDDADKDEEPSAGSDRGSKRRREGKEPEESARDVYSKRRIIAVTELQIVEWHTYKHLDWITMRKLTNLTVEERFAFNISLRIFTRSIVIQRRVEDLQLGVESYQKKLNLTKPDTYRSDLKRKEAYTAYSNLKGFIYQNKDTHNRLMRIDELHKFSDGTLNDVRTALDDRLKGIRMKYLPQTI